MQTLWTKSPDEAVFCRRFSAAEKKILENVFSMTAQSSPFAEALHILSLASRGERLVRWHEDVPYFNTSAFVEIISGGAMMAVPRDDGYAFRLSYSPARLWALIKNQFRIARFVAHGASAVDDITISLALGLALQSYMLQLGAAARQLPGFLANPAAVPLRYRRLVQQIQAVQVKRTALSLAWTKLFPAGRGDAPPPGLPNFFWNEPPALAPAPQKAGADQKLWRGHPVCGGMITGKIVTDANDIPADGPLIFVFPYARPETTEVFGRAAGLIFAEGGALSHACTVARERNIPAATGFGPGMYDFAKRNAGAWLTLDGGAGVAELVESPKDEAAPNV